MVPRPHLHASMRLCAAALLVVAAAGFQQLPQPSLTDLRKAASRVARGVTPFSTISNPPPAATTAGAAAATTSAPVRTPQPATAYPPMQYSGGDGQVR